LSNFGWTDPFKGKLMLEIRALLTRRTDRIFNQGSTILVSVLKKFEFSKSFLWKPILEILTRRQESCRPLRPTRTPGPGGLTICIKTLSFMFFRGYDFWGSKLLVYILANAQCAWWYRIYMCSNMNLHVFERVANLVKLSWPVHGVFSRWTYLIAHSVQYIGGSRLFERVAKVTDQHLKSLWVETKMI